MTAQVHEELIIDGKKTSMAFCPPLPENDSRVIKLKDDEINNNEITSSKHSLEELSDLFEDDRIIFSTACWREYIGTWENKNKKFYLVRLKGRYRIQGNAPIFADWFTGILRIPQGEILFPVNMGYGSVFESELHISIDNGEVIGARVIDNRNKEFDED